MEKITEVKGYELIDSRGNPTVGCFVATENGGKGFAIVPSGASTGTYEANEKRDNDDSRYGGKGVLRAVKNIDEIIAPALTKYGFFDQKKLDDFLILLDGSENKANLGANAILGVSLAFAKASASAGKMPLYKYLGGENAKKLPVPMMNILNGGAHAFNNVDIQEFMIVPHGIQGYAKQLRAGCEIYHSLGKILKNSGASTGVGDEGGFAPALKDDEEALVLITEAIEAAGYNTQNVGIALDVAATEWVREDKYYLPKRGVEKTADELIDYYMQLTEKYPIISIEDGLGEDDFHCWKKLTDYLGKKINLVGDDLFVTNKNRLKTGVEKGIANSILIKLNQIGTLSETLNVINLAKDCGYKNIISHRSGESEDSFIADLAVAVNAPYIKTGAPCRGERTAKYNRLLIIEKEL